MSKQRTEINPISADRVKEILRRENITQTQLSGMIFQTQQNISRIMQKRQPLTKETAEAIVAAFPERRYRAAYLLGYDDDLTEDDRFDRVISNLETEHDKTVAIVRHLANLRNIDINLYVSASGSGGESVELFVVHDGKQQTFISYSDMTDLIDDFVALTAARISRIGLTKKGES